MVAVVVVGIAWGSDWRRDARSQQSDHRRYWCRAGLVDARKANAVHIALARANGATVLERTPVQSLRPSDESVEVVTDQGSFMAGQLIVTSGAWTNRVLGSVATHWPLTVTQEQVTYFATPHLREFSPEIFPIWIWRDVEEFYGFPIYGEVATKAGQDVGGHEVTAETRTFEPDLARTERLKAFLGEHIPHFLGPELYTKTCLYTMPPDRSFIIGTLSKQPRISVAVGAGHGFKFAGVIGRTLSELALDGETTHPIDTFRPDRPALTDPNFEPLMRNEAVLQRA